MLPVAWVIERFLEGMSFWVIFPFQVIIDLSSRLKEFMWHGH